MIERKEFFLKKNNDFGIIIKSLKFLYCKVSCNYGTFLIYSILAYFFLFFGGTLLHFCSYYFFCSEKLKDSQNLFY